MKKEYKIRSTGVSAYEGNDLGVYDTSTGELLKGFNSLSNDYAYTCAQEYITFLYTQNWDHVGISYTGLFGE